MIFRAVLVCAFSLMSVAAGAQTVDEPEGYQGEHYDGPVPYSITGGTAVDPDAAFALWSTERVAFIDVLPRAPKPKNLPEGTIWREKPRDSIPGALWLPNVGYARLADVTHAYFKTGLEKATKGDLSYPVVFFCLDECWMSWNAAKRALEYGYTHVFWFAQGTDGWEFEDYPTERLEPEHGY